MTSRSEKGTRKARTPLRLPSKWVYSAPIGVWLNQKLSDRLTEIASYRSAWYLVNKNAPLDREIGGLPLGIIEILILQRRALLKGAPYRSFHLRRLVPVYYGKVADICWYPDDGYESGLGQC